MIGKNIKQYCCEDVSLIENYYDAINDDTELWIIHHKLEIELNLSKQQLIDMCLYKHRPASELMFMRNSEHNSLHHKGTHNSEEQKEKIRKKLAGRTLSESHKQHISEGNKGKKRTEEQKQYISVIRKKYWEEKNKQY